ncbi:MAG TPA: NAD(P)/FAD-dependent oxidoreductase [Pyrinomonadaceae bacterium]|jgi:thioredoxin reductase|nr:NAD(P)/FAD-dependent oxidoreductase [Pyrinomonadaceae bacterium]
MFDVIIVGAGPAGLSAALVLGRCRRRVLVCDAGTPRNARSHALHGYLTRDGIEPAEFLRLGREQLRQYQTVEFMQAEVTDARQLADNFEITLRNGERLSGRKLLLATGVVDHIPEVEGVSEFYGISVFHCPYCDGWEMRDQPLAVYGRGENGAGLSLELTLWSRDIVLCTDGPAELPEEDRRRLLRHNITLKEDRIARLVGNNGALEHIVFADGESLARGGMFFSTGQHQASDLAEKLGCKLTEQGCVDTGDYEATSIPGLYVAGDASRFVQLVIVAASEGAQAAFAINKELMKKELV